MLYHKKTGNGIVEVEVNGFYSVLEDMIRFTPDMLPTMARYRNFGEVTTKGVEGEIKADVFSWLYLYANTTYQDLRDVRKTLPGTSAPNPSYDLRMPNIPYFLANSGAEIHKNNLFGGKGQNTRFLLDVSYVHEYFYDFEMSKNQERKIPSSLTFDGAIEHSFMNNRLFVTLKVKNITDREVYSELNRPLPGRQFGMKLRYIFK